MWGHARFTGALAAGIFIAGFSALGSAPASREGLSSSASIVAVAKVEYPLGAAPADDFLFSGSIALADNPTAISPDVELSTDRVLLYTPSTELYIEVTSADRGMSPLRLLPEKVETMSNADESKGLYRLEIPDLSLDAVGRSGAPLIITLVPTGI